MTKLKKPETLYGFMYEENGGWSVIQAVEKNFNTLAETEPFFKDVFEGLKTQSVFVLRGGMGEFIATFSYKRRLAESAFLSIEMASQF